MALRALCAVIRLFLARGLFLACVVVPGAVPGFVSVVRSGRWPRIWRFKTFCALGGPLLRVRAKNASVGLFGALYGLLWSFVLSCSAGLWFGSGLASFGGLIGSASGSLQRFGSGDLCRRYGGGLGS